MATNDYACMPVNLLKNKSDKDIYLFFINVNINIIST